MNLRCIDIYVVTAEGSHRYDAESHGLVRLDGAHSRALTGGQNSMNAAPVALVYVREGMARMFGLREDQRIVLVHAVGYEVAQ